MLRQLTKFHPISWMNLKIMYIYQWTKELEYLLDSLGEHWLLKLKYPFNGLEWNDNAVHIPYFG